MVFPNILGFLSTDSDKPEKKFAAVINGRLQATNHHIACYIAAETFCPNPEVIEGKIFTSEDLIAMRGEDIVFSAEGYNIAGFDVNPMPFQGSVNPETLKISLYDDIMDEDVETELTFPDIPAIMPAMTASEPDPAKVQKRNTHFRGANVAPKLLSTIADSFQNKKPGYVRLEFFHNKPGTEKAERPSAAILVSPLKSDFELYKEMAVIMPVF